MSESLIKTKLAISPLGADLVPGRAWPGSSIWPWNVNSPLLSPRLVLAKRPCYGPG